MPRIVVPFLALLAAAVPASARTWYILPDGSGDAPTIQAGVDSSADGDTVLVAPGNYFERVSINGQGITLRSDLGPQATTISGGGEPSLWPVVTIHDWHHVGPVVEGFTITGGNTVWPSALGGGVSCEDGVPILRGNVIRGNEAGIGGGLQIGSSANALVLENVIEDNVGTTYAGGIAMDGGLGATILENTVRRNSASFDGGGIYLVHMGGEAVVIVRGNQITDNAAGGNGGGILAEGNDIPIEDNVIARNSAGERGGGVYANYRATLRRNVIAENGSSVEGGGIFFEQLGSVQPFTIENCTVTANEAPSGSAFSEWITWGGGTFSHAVVALNRGGLAIRCHNLGELISFECCDIWGNDPGGVGGTCSDPTGTDGNFSEDPQFCDPTRGDYALCSDSPCLEGYGCGLIGALGEGCGPSATEPATWGVLKTLFR
jgi:Right handed beta helix region